MSVRVLEGDCRALLPTLPDASVQMVCTSPPYFGLRDYGTASWDGGDPRCDHTQPATPHTGLLAAAIASDGESRNTSGTRAAKEAIPYRDLCGKCGACRIDRQIGLESSVDEYVAEMVSVFREVRRVLRDDGVLFLNLGDSYAGSWGAQSRGHDASGNLEGGSMLSARQITAHPKGSKTGSIKGEGLKPKDLIGVPWRVGFALQADGWWLRSDIIWAKPNPMPESVRDRPTKAHEYIFLLTKSPRYFWDAEAVKEPGELRDYGPDKIKRERNVGGRADGFTGTNGGYGLGHNGTRNIRSVWTIATAPFPEAHFATFPPALAERCIKAGTSEKGACRACGSPWERVLETGSTKRQTFAGSNGQQEHPSGVSHTLVPITRETVGWQPTCSCDAGDPVPCVVLDPFAGAGTTGLVADRLGRDAVLIELNQEYCAMMRRRITNDAPLFAEVV